MNDIAVRVENLGKLYRIGQFAGYKTIRETMTNVISGPLRRFRHPSRESRSTLSATSHQPNSIWALKDVSFEVKRGEAVGIIGRNGSGKSTLLKILSRITAPTEGRAEIHGRVGTLLEVGTGFHPELTGRENIYLNGAVIGMKKAEVERKFDEMVDFAEIENFLDTPVKRYSSGMYVRLAFAVAAHLAPDILLVDEVLSVGDAQFQKKCLGKMQSATGEGRTVLFVSHNMAAVSMLCNRALLLKEGRVIFSGHTPQAMEAYLSSGAGVLPEVKWDFNNAPGGESARLRAVRVLNSNGEISYDHDYNQPVILEMDFWVLRPDRQINPGFDVYNQQGICLFCVWNVHDTQWGDRRLEPGLYRSQCRIPANYLNEGKHQIAAAVVENQSRHVAFVEEAVSFHIHDSGINRGSYTGAWGGVIRPLLPWTLQRIEALSI
jgi:lipopolysaccharide transport system ATP-binding protein